MTSSSADDRPDAELVAAFQHGDEQAFTTIVERYKHRLLRLALSVVRNDDDALDVLQDALVKAYHGLRAFRQSSTLYTWLYRIVMNHAIDYVRRRPQVVIESTSELLHDLPDTTPSVRPDRELMNAELRERIFAAVDKLPPKHRQVIILRELEGMSYKDIAAVVGCSEGTVMSRLFYARERLRQALEPYLKYGQ
ncbi:MAG: sigma-70 family RNA polymerase sigma factor [bacterium]|nr:sigma-70 family RNA polymerase sigma factor [bacterium]